MDDGGFRARYGPWALIAGASEGIGREFATQLAQRGLKLVLIARRTEPLEELAHMLRTRYAADGARKRPTSLRRPVIRPSPVSSSGEPPRPPTL